MKSVYGFSGWTGRVARPVPYRRGVKRGHFGASLIAAMVWAAVAAVVAGFLQFRGGGPGWFASPSAERNEAAASGGDTLHASFSICRGPVRRNCVVDGDTFWFRGEKIRIADIDAPELSPSRCAREERLGEAAKHRLLALLNAGHFSLITGERGEDRYRRKLRTVHRNGRSIGDILVAEGLARQWTGRRRSWCG